MLSKCANPECVEVFRYLHQGKIFHLCPTPEVQAATDELSPVMYERFWLCERCSKQLTVVWGGTHARLVPLPAKPGQVESISLLPATELSLNHELDKVATRGKAAYVGRDDG